MPRHSPDDFSFLPTVDSADEEPVSKEASWGKPPDPAPVPHYEEPAQHEEATFESNIEEPQPHPDMGHPVESPEPPMTIAPPTPLLAAERLSVNAPKVRVFAPDTGELPLESRTDSGQDGRALWEAYAEEQGIDASAIVTPKAAGAARSEPEAHVSIQPPGTSRISFGRGFGSIPPPPPVERAALPEQRELKEETPTPSDAVHAVDEPDAAPADNSGDIKKARQKALIATLALHVFVALILLLMHVPMLDFSPPEIVATSTVDELENESWKKVTTAVPQTSPMAASVSPLLSTGISEIAMPDVDFAANTSDLNLGSSFGSFGSGVTSGGAGGKVSFLGNTATAKHVIFVVDVSGSMSASMNVGGTSMSRFDLLKKELSKSISAMPAGAAYQILFFSDFAWPHDVVDSNDPSAMNKYRWEITSSSQNPEIPRFSYLAMNGPNISKTKKIIAEANNPGGTNWGSGLMMALKGSPKPDVIFFMTDGNRNDEQGWINTVSQANSRGKRTIIHTTAMGTPDAARDLDEMARRNGGKFTAVMADGKILQGKDLIP